MEHTTVIERHPMDDDANHEDLWYRGSRVAVERATPLRDVGEFAGPDTCGYDFRVGWSEKAQRLVDKMARVEQAVRDRERQRALTAATTTRPDTSRIAAEAAYLYVVQGLTLAETGKRVGCSSPTVASLLRDHGHPIRRPGPRTVVPQDAA